MADNQTTPQQEPMPSGPDRTDETLEGTSPAAKDAPASAGVDKKQATKEKPPIEKPRKGSWLTPILRMLAAAAILFLLGALAVFFWLYRPADQQLKSLQAEATQTAGQLERSQSDLQQAQTNLKEAQGQADTAQQTLEVELARSEVLRAINDLTFARMALQAEDKEGVTKALTDSENRLTEVLPLVEERDPEQASTLKALYTLAKNDLERDLSLAGQDLDRLQTELERVEANVLVNE